MKKIFGMWDSLIGVIQPAGEWLALLPIRLLIGYEFASSGFVKFNASDTLWGDVPNWFAGMHANYPFPFNVLPIELNWFLVTWVEILGGIALFIGLFTRFWAVSLTIVTVVAIAAVHWPDDWSSLAELWKGYAVTNRGFGNFRIPLLFIAMLVPLVFAGGGKLSLDRIIYGKLGQRFR